MHQLMDYAGCVHPHDIVSSILAGLSHALGWLV